jgi:rSAM/selenodomain-associated transferase 1
VSQSSRAGCCICIFAKPPRAGEVKTRLAKSLGAENAAHLAHQFLLDTWTSVRRLRWAHPILASAGRLPRPLRPARAELWLQGQGDLGNRLERILRRALRNYSQAIAIGADTPGLPTGFLIRARSELSHAADAAIGPTEDGGFYLLGLTRCPSGLLDNVAWGGSTVFSQTFDRLKRNHMRIAVLDAWFDVDRVEDLRRLKKLIRQRVVRAPRTERALGLGHGST